MLAVAWALVWAGSGPSPAAESLQTEPPPPEEIVGGTDVPAGKWDEVVSFIVGGRFCSGTLLTSKLVLTAAHCTQGIDASVVGQVAVLFGTDARNPVQVGGVTMAATYPKFCDACTHDRFDMGVLVLNGTVSLPNGFPEVITDQDTWDQVMHEGQEIDVVGFGQTQDGQPTNGNDLGVGVEREVILKLAPYGDDGYDFRTHESGKGTCNGDSGGPAMVKLPDGRRIVTGVLSAGFGNCGQGSLFNVPWPVLPWIRDQTGIDLLPKGCPDADCLDTTIASNDHGCGCRLSRSASAGSGAAPAGWEALVGLWGLLAVRRRRRRAACSGRPRALR